ncbi:MAG: mechanosensitive ion channel family protein [Bacteroidota bacterium]
MKSTKFKTNSKPEKPEKRRLSSRKNTVKGAKGKLKNFRQASVLAVSITGILLMLFSFTENNADSVSISSPYLTSEDSILQNANSSEQNEKATEEAIGALQDLWDSFHNNAPKLLIALSFIILSWLLIKLIRYSMRKGLRKLPSSTGIISMVSILLWILVVGVVFSIIAGDMRALIGSFGLIGLALSWALQTPIESFTGWLLNAFKFYYKIGDRIKVGEVFGDVYKIDFLTTTIWEIGSPSQPGFVNAEQPTGRLVTFPNNEILAGSIVNLTRDFPYVWDELVISITNESDIERAMRILEEASDKIIGEYMKKPILQYSNILQKAGLPSNLPSTPQVYLSPGDSWIDITIRYLVDARERRQWKSDLFLYIYKILAVEENNKNIFPVYPRYQVQFISEDTETERKFK